jgi:ankyrin repeat protein
MKSFKQFLFEIFFVGNENEKGFDAKLAITDYIKHLKKSINSEPTPDNYNTYELLNAIMNEDTNKIKNLSLVTNKNFNVNNFIHIQSPNYDVANFKLTPLMIASMFQKNKSISQLIKSGANLELKDVTGNTALSLVAMEDNSLKTMKELVNVGANINVVNKNGDSIVGLALDGGHFDEAKYLLKQGAKVFYVEIPTFEEKLNDKIINLIANTEQIVDEKHWG